MTKKEISLRRKHLREHNRQWPGDGGTAVFIPGRDGGKPQPSAFLSTSIFLGEADGDRACKRNRPPWPLNNLGDASAHSSCRSYSMADGAGSHVVHRYWLFGGRSISVAARRLGGGSCAISACNGYGTERSSPALFCMAHHTHTLLFFARPHCSETTQRVKFFVELTPLPFIWKPK